MSAEARKRRLLDRDGRADPCLLCRPFHITRPVFQHLAERQVIDGIGGLIAFEDDRLSRSAATSLRIAANGKRLDLAEIIDALRLGQPYDLERMIAGQESVLIVVNRLAWPAQKTRRFVALVAENEMRI